MRILILIAIGLLLYLIISNLIRKQKRLGAERNEQDAEKMVRCKHCGLHILEKEAILKKGQYYCCQEHADA